MVISGGYHKFETEDETIEGYAAMGLGRTMHLRLSRSGCGYCLYRRKLFSPGFADTDGHTDRLHPPGHDQAGIDGVSTTCGCNHGRKRESRRRKCLKIVLLL